MSIVTKTGDEGWTTVGYHQVRKHSLVVNVLGELDELSCMLGVVGAVASSPMFGIQVTIYKICTLINSSDTTNELEIELIDINQRIDELEKILLPLHGFIAPAGIIHLARAVCRRAERGYFSLPTINKSAGIYLNRLSDYLFLLARYDNNGSERYIKVSTLNPGENNNERNNTNSIEDDTTTGGVCDSPDPYRDVPEFLVGTSEDSQESSSL